jgi:hypothetical protein
MGYWPYGDGIGVGSNQDGRLEVFLIGTNSILYTSYQTAPNGGWSGWVSLGGTWPIGDAIGVGSNKDGRLEVFLIGTNSILYTSYQTAPNGGWSGWVSLGGTWPNGDAIGVGSNQDGRLEVFLVDNYYKLYTSYQTAPNGGWSSWVGLGGTWPYGDAIGVGSNQDGRLEVFLVDNYYKLYTSYQTAPNGGWSPWTSLGGAWQSIDDIAVARNTDGHLSVFLEGENNALFTTYQTPPSNAWSPFVSLGGNWPDFNSGTDSNNFQAGYMQAPAAGTAPYTAVQATFKVPTINKAAGCPPQSSDPCKSSTWVGIGNNIPGGFVIQTGTEADLSKNGTTTYYAWTEVYPKGGQQKLPLTISPGDIVIATVEETAVNTWLMRVCDLECKDVSVPNLAVPTSAAAEAIHERTQGQLPPPYLTPTSNVMFGLAAYSLSAPGSPPIWQHFFVIPSGATLYNLPMCPPGDPNKVCPSSATPSGVDSDIDGFQVADGTNVPPPPPS